jgi:hypothetical protein
MLQKMIRAGKNSGKKAVDSIPVLKKCLFLLLWLAPAVWLFRLIWIYGVDIPHSDQWNGSCPLFIKDHDGTLGVADFFAQHNEHRIFFPRLIMFGLGKLTHWNVFAELWTMWFLACVCTLNLWRLAQVTGWNPFRAPWLIFVTNLFVFSPLGHENWLFGFQIGFLLPVVCYTAVLWIAPSVRFPLNFLLTFVVSTICTFSIASGFTCWLMAFPLLLLPDFKLHWNEKRGWWLFWIAGFLGTTFLYFHGYQKPPGHPDPYLAFEHPLQAFLFLLAYLGNPFSQGTMISVTVLAQITGFVLVAALVTAALYLWRWRRDKFLIARTLPWFILSFVAFFNGALVTIGRFGFGIDSALAPRYMPFCLTLPIALLFLVPVIFHHWPARDPLNKSRIGMGVSAMASALLLLHLLGVSVCEENWKLRYHLWLTTKAEVELIDIVDDPEAIANYIFPKVELVRTEANALDSFGYLRPGILHSKAIGPIAAPLPTEPSKFGQIQQAGKPAEGQFGLMGWAILPDKSRIADVVLLTYDDPKGDSTIFAVAQVGVPRPEVASTLGQPNYDRAGWEKVFNLSLLPPGAGPIRAWAFDAEICRAYPLQGVATAAP